ncbi:glycoside hydrolase family 16 protein [Bremerella cremea]|uniref:glycoside hydrolase family 16 protein n=1 Tax=Bremerella cremea TaxID=1031537 RepID=UPI0031ECDB86
MMLSRMLLLLAMVLSPLVSQLSAEDVPALPKQAKLVLEENWLSGEIDPECWYVFRKQWGGGNHGVVPENVVIGKDEVNGTERNVLICTAHGDRYDGPVKGWWGNKTRVGGVIVSQEHFASGRFEVVMKIGEKESHDGGPADPTRPKGCIPALWTYAYRWVEGDKARKDEFQPETPMYNPHIPAYGMAANAYWSELDFPEFGKAGNFDDAMYNTFLQNRHDNRFFSVAQAVDGEYHTFTTEWRTHLREMPAIRDSQVIESDGFYWVQDKSIPFADYLGNPLKKLGENRYALYEGKIATHYIDGKKVAENDKWVPAMSAQLTMGVWLPDWAGPADWKTASMKVASVKVWQFGDEGDVMGVMKGRTADSFGIDGTPFQ